MDRRQLLALGGAASLMPSVLLAAEPQDEFWSDAAKANPHAQLVRDYIARIRAESAVAVTTDRLFMLWQVKLANPEFHVNQIGVWDASDKTFLPEEGLSIHIVDGRESMPAALVMRRRYLVLSSEGHREEISYEILPPRFPLEDQGNFKLSFEINWS